MSYLFIYNSLPLEDAKALIEDIKDNFELGKERLSADDHHLLDRSLDEVLAMSLANQLAWRQGIKNARIAFEKSTTASMDQMHSFMANWCAAPD